MMGRILISTLIAGTLLAAGLSPQLVGEPISIASSESTAAESEIVARVLKMAKSSNLDELPAIPARPHVIPPDGIDVVRVRMEGTYTINGIGNDRVELSGWFACIHRKVPSAQGYTSWETGVVDIEFAGFDIRGESRLFGPVHVYLNPDLPSHGRVGAIYLPELEEMGPRFISEKRAGCTDPPCPACVAVMNLKIDMPMLGLQMQTKEALRSYSFVDTIPPVGSIPSFTLKPTELVINSRVVGSIQDATTKQRDIVIKAQFDTNAAQ